MNKNTIITKIFLFSFILIISINLQSCSLFGDDDDYGPRKSSKGIIKPSVVLLHGLGEDSKSFDFMKDELTKAKDVVNKVYAIETDKTYENSISEQADALFDEIKKQKLTKQPILLIGHSQGGLRGYELIRRHGKDLNILALVTIGTPWEGALVLNNMTEAQSLVNDLPPALNFLKSAIDQYENFETKPGVKDMVPASDFLKNIEASLATNQTPIVAIAGILPTDQITTLLSATGLDASTIQPMIQQFGNIVAGGEKHDGLLSVSSQAAKNYNNKPAFTAIEVDGLVHAPSFPLMGMGSDLGELSNPIVAQEIIKYLKNSKVPPQ